MAFPPLDLATVETALAAEAAAHATAAAALNPFLDAEVVELGSARLVYAGAFSAVHGVFALGLDGPPEERDWQEIERFFRRKERAAHFWVTPFTDPTVVERLRRTHRITKTLAVRGRALEQHAHEPDELPPIEPKPGPDLDRWALQFSRRENPARTEADLLALTKLHQRQTRFYGEGTHASYTFFHRGLALVPYPDATLLPLQEKENFRSHGFLVLGEGALPLLYERNLYEPV